MSKARDDLDNSVDAARKIVEWLSSFSFIDSIWLGGSRSPDRKRQPSEGSDWDIIAVVSTQQVRLPNLRRKGFHGDLLIVDKPLPRLHKTVMLWPVDVQGVLNGI